jgi:flagellin-like protein
MTRLQNDQGVSVIIGTLLLILITVTAAAALGLMISQMQKAEMTRQSQITAVKDEDIVISGVSLANNANLWGTSPYNISNSQNWSSISFNLMNLNTQDAGVAAIAINNYYEYPINFTSLSLSTPQGYCNLTVEGSGCQVLGSNSNTPYLTIPAGKSIQVTLNLTSSLTGSYSPSIETGNQIDIKILTSLTNIFEQTYRLPTPVIIYNTETTTLGSIQRDNIALDGSQSSSENATIVSWNWTLMNATQTMTNGVIDPIGNCSDVNDLSTVSVPPYFNSKISHFSPLISGPFCVNLTVTDSNGMIATSPYQLIPKDLQFDPPSSIILSPIPETNELNVTINSISNIPVPGQAVSYSINQYSDSYPFIWTLISPNSVSQTDQYGNVTYQVCGNGTATISSGQLATKSITFVDNPCTPTPTPTPT